MEEQRQSAPGMTAELANLGSHERTTWQADPGLSRLADNLAVANATIARLQEEPERRQGGSDVTEPGAAGSDGHMADLPGSSKSAYAPTDGRPKVDGSTHSVQQAKAAHPDPLNCPYEICLFNHGVQIKS
eukprot:12408431-Karenia_brevis.AAC.3